MTDFDTLTGIRHGRAFNSCLVSAINDARTTAAPLALFYMNIDHMKHFNVHNGYRAGDMLLRRFATLVTTLLNTQHTLFRIGGDGFAIILLDVGRVEAVERAYTICVRVRETLAPSQPLHCGDPYCLGPAKIAVSIGISLFDDTMDAGQLLHSAEKKVADAKNAGGDQARI